MTISYNRHFIHRTVDPSASPFPVTRLIALQCLRVMSQIENGAFGHAIRPGASRSAVSVEWQSGSDGERRDANRAPRTARLKMSDNERLTADVQ